MTIKEVRAAGLVVACSIELHRVVITLRAFIPRTLQVDPGIPLVWTRNGCCRNRVS